MVAFRIHQVGLAPPGGPSRTLGILGSGALRAALIGVKDAEQIPGMWLSPLRSSPGICSALAALALDPEPPSAGNGPYQGNGPAVALHRATDPVCWQLGSPGVAQRSNTTRSRSGRRVQYGSLVVGIRIEVLITEAGRGSVQRRIGQIGPAGFHEDRCVEPRDLFGEDEELCEVDVARHCARRSSISTSRLSSRAARALKSLSERTRSISAVSESMTT